MSFRPVGSCECKRGPSAGSIFGPAIGHGVADLWSNMAISPPRTPPTAPISAPSPPPLDLDDAGLLGPADPLPGEVVVEGVVTMFDCVGVENVALVRFAQEPNSSTVLVGSSAPRVRNYDYVVGKPVCADNIVWKPMSAPNGLRGHLFTMEHNGRTTTRIETTVDAQGRLERLAVVDASYSPLAAASGMADPSAMLEYANPAQHLQELRALAQRMRTDCRVGYVPTLELCVGEALEALPMTFCSAEGKSLVHAKAAWTATRRYLQEMSQLTAENARRHATAELTQAGAAHALEPLHGAWRTSVV